MSAPRTKAGRSTLRDFEAYVKAVPGDGDFAVDGLLATLRRDRQSSLEQIRGAILGIEDETLEQAAQVAEQHAERLKHTSHHDGLGMGWQAGEELCREIATRIHAFAVTPAVKPDKEAVLSAIEAMKVPASLRLMPADDWISVGVLRSILNGSHPVLATPAAKPETGLDVEALEESIFAVATSISYDRLTASKLTYQMVSRLAAAEYVRRTASEASE